MTGEYRHGSVTMTFLVSPRRGQVVAAKAIASLASGALLGLVAVVLNTIVVLVWFAISGDDLGVSVGKVIGIDAGAIALTALLTLFGFGVGVIVRNQVAAIVILLGLLFVVDPLISGFVDVLGKWSLKGLTSAVTGGQSGGDNPPNLFSPVVSGLVLLLYGMILQLDRICLDGASRRRLIDAAAHIVAFGSQARPAWLRCCHRCPPSRPCREPRCSSTRTGACWPPTPPPGVCCAAIR